MKNLNKYLVESIRNIPTNICDAIKYAMKFGYLEQRENGKAVKYGISRENLLNVIDYDNKFTKKDIEDLIADYEKNNAAKFRFEKDEEWKKAGYKDPNAD